VLWRGHRGRDRSHENTVIRLGDPEYRVPLHSVTGGSSGAQPNDETERHHMNKTFKRASIVAGGVGAIASISIASFAFFTAVSHVTAQGDTDTRRSSAPAMP
jgi:hypothetical protein